MLMTAGRTRRSLPRSGDSSLWEVGSGFVKRERYEVQQLLK
jgi:hypothetical protein